MIRLAATALCLTILTCTEPLFGSDESLPIDVPTLAERLTALERAAREAEPAEVRGLVRQFAEQMVHAKVKVESGRVIATYTREGWKTRPYFAVNSVPEDYVYTGELDGRFQADLAAHVHWVSVVKSLPDRQLMFEIAIDEAAVGALRPQEIIDFTCEIAGIIRGGKSVYGRLVALRTGVERAAGATERDQ